MGLLNNKIIPVLKIPRSVFTLWKVSIFKVILNFFLDFISRSRSNNNNNTFNSIWML
jgi:hypothetical protein